MYLYFHHTVSFKNARLYLPHSHHIPQTYHAVSQNFREHLTFLLLCKNLEYSSPIKLLSKTKIFKRKHTYTWFLSLQLLTLSHSKFLFIQALGVLIFVVVLGWLSWLQMELKLSRNWKNWIFSTSFYPLLTTWTILQDYRSPEK